MATPLDRFLELLQRSELLNPSQVVASCADFPMSHGDDRAVNDLCKHLIGKGLLTEWQCDKLRQRKWKGFFLDGYCLLSHVRKDETSAYYLCRDVATGKYMTLRVTAPGDSPDGTFQYEFQDPPSDLPLNG